MTFIAAALLIYVAFVCVMYVMQRSYLYFPSTFQSYDEAFLQKQDILHYEQDGLQWLGLPSVFLSNRVLVYFHGNGGAAIDRVAKMRVWANAGFKVIMVEYPGYGTNEGEPSEESFYNAGRVAIDRAISGWPDAELYIYGELIGSGTAVQMATEYPVKALIIESGFSSLVDVAQSKMPFVPVSLLLKDRYDNVAKINHSKADLFIIHGNRDTIVLMKFGERLFKAYNGRKEMIIINGAGHNDIYQQTDIGKIIEKIKQ